MKDKRDKQKEKSQKIVERLIEKQEKLKEIKKEREKYKKKLENKLEKITQKKELLDKKREMKYENIKKQRSKLFKKIKINKKEIEKEEGLRREDILIEEQNKLGKFYLKEDFDKIELNNIKSKTLELFQKDYELRKDFLKKMSKLKDESVFKKSDKQKRKIYNDQLKLEAERRKIEEEEKLEKLKV